MKPILLKVIIILVAAAIIVPSGYYAYQYFNKSNEVATYNPMDYIPGNSTFISTVNHNNSLYYIFYDDSSLGVVLNASNNNVINGNELSMLSSVNGINSNITLNHNNMTITSSTYKGVSVFEAKNVSLNLILSEITGNKNITNKTINLYFYVISDKYIIAGEHTAIKDSIIANKDNKNACSLSNYINTNYNSSMYYALKNKSMNINYITLNSTANKTYVTITPYNMTELKEKIYEAKLLETELNQSKTSNLTGIQNISKITTNKDNATLEINIGFTGIINILKNINIKK